MVWESVADDEVLLREGCVGGYPASSESQHESSEGVDIGGLYPVGSSAAGGVADAEKLCLVEIGGRLKS